MEEVAGSKDRAFGGVASFARGAFPAAAGKFEDAGPAQVYDYEGGTKDWFEHKDSQAVE